MLTVLRSRRPVLCSRPEVRLRDVRYHEHTENRPIRAKKKVIPVLVPRAREVGQSYFTSIFTTLNACWASVRVYVKTKPDAILANGPGTCIPVITACFVGKIVGFNRRCKVMYVESVSRTKRMSLSGRLCYSLRLADVVFVMWPELKETYPRAKFCGRIY